ncbi:MAG: TonB-dependent receptor domain-containing protein, partial [Asticcacaulis sp.]
RIDQENDGLAGQLNLTQTVHAGGWTHDLAGGAELNRKHQSTPAFTTTGMTIAAASLYHPNPDDSLPVPLPAGAGLDGRIETRSAWLFDTARPGPHWLVNAGVRLDAYTVSTDGKVVSTATSYPSLPVGSIVPVDLKTHGTIASWNLGAVYKPRENASLYVAWGNAATPPGSANLTLSATAGNIANTAFKPAQATTFEAGAKWNLPAGRLGLTAAGYVTEAKDELAQLDSVTNSYAQLGKRRIDGIELSASGQITPGWQLSAGLQTLHTRVIQGTSGNNAAGAATRWSPDLTATLWTTKRVTSRLSVGGGANYVSDQKLVVNPAVNPATFAGIPKIPAYWVASAMAALDLTPRLTLQMNVQNLFNHRYIASLNNGGSRLIPGAPQSGVLSLIAKF